MHRFSSRIKALEEKYSPDMGMHLIIRDERGDSFEPLSIDGNIVLLNGRTAEQAIKDYSKEKGFLLKESNCLEICLLDFKGDEE